ncbi:MAG: phosphotransferase [Patescibacteria group bacterium]
MQNKDLDLHALFQALAEMTHLHGTSAVPMTGGKNNRLFRMETEEGVSLVIKQYYPDDRKRLMHEYEVLTALAQRGFTDIPRPIARFDAWQVGVFSFVEGENIPTKELTPKHMEQIAAHLARLHAFTMEEVAEPLPMGSMSVRSYADAITHIRKRMVPFSGDAIRTLHPHLQAFLHEVPVASIVESRLEIFLKKHSPEDVTRRTPDNGLCLSSVDIGPHNMLWRADGSLVVLDWEYAGWDHPMHSIAGFLAHDRTQRMGHKNIDAFMDAYLRCTPLDQSVLEVLDPYLELYRLNWLAIYLTTLLPSRLERWAFAEGSLFDQEAVVQRQMDRVRVLLTQIT